MPEEQKKKAIAEFNFTKGILVATFSGIMSACFSFALTGGQTHQRGLARRPAPPSSGPACRSSCVVLLGGFTTNFIWCVLLNVKNRTGYQYFASHVRQEHAHHGGIGRRRTRPAERPRSASADLKDSRAAQLSFLARWPGRLWYFQFFFYTMGETQMGKFSFASWTLHMASIIIFSTMWGWILPRMERLQQKGALLIAGGIATLILSTIIIGAGAGWTSLTAFMHHSL